MIRKRQTDMAREQEGETACLRRCFGVQAKLDKAIWTNWAMAGRRIMPLKQAVSGTSKRMDNEASMSFERLVASIRQMHEELASRAGCAVNVCLTARNWLIGLVIFEYEQHGSDRAAYGEQLLERLAERLRKEGMERVEARELRRYRQFYLAYPQIRETLSPELDRLAPQAGSPRTLAQIPESKPERSGNRETESPKWALPGEKLLHALSFSHFDLLIQIDDPLERAFYEVECIRGNWSVRELRRQSASLYFERSGLSKNKKKPAALVRKKAEPAAPVMAIRDPYVFEFLGLKPREAMVESQLQDALLDNHLFVSKYRLELPRKEDIQRFIEEQVREADDGK